MAILRLAIAVSLLCLRNPIQAWGGEWQWEWEGWGQARNWHLMEPSIHASPQPNHNGKNTIIFLVNVKIIGRPDKNVFKLKPPALFFIFCKPQST